MNIDFLNSMIRAAMQMVAGYLVTKGMADASIVEPLTGAGVSIAALVWSYFTHSAAK